jgi:uncharacterized protein (DUF433 family)
VGNAIGNKFERWRNGNRPHLNSPLKNATVNANPFAETLKPGKFRKLGNMKDVHKLIEITSEKRFGQPCIKGTRISVYDILSMLAKGLKNEQIVQDFPELTEESIKAALRFAADKQNSLRVAS